MQINVEHNPSSAKLDVMHVDSWPIWEKEVSEFPWTYDQSETCYILTGEVLVTPESGKPVLIKESDLVNFPKGMTCTWKIIRPIRKHYLFE